MVLVFQSKVNSFFLTEKTMVSNYKVSDDVKLTSEPDAWLSGILPKMFCASHLWSGTGFSYSRVPIL